MEQTGGGGESAAAAVSRSRGREEEPTKLRHLTIYLIIWLLLFNGGCGDAGGPPTSVFYVRYRVKQRI